MLHNIHLHPKPATLETVIFPPFPGMYQGLCYVAPPVTRIQTCEQTANLIAQRCSTV